MGRHQHQRYVPPEPQQPTPSRTTPRPRSWGVATAVAAAPVGGGARAGGWRPQGLAPGPRPPRSPSPPPPVARATGAASVAAASVPRTRLAAAHPRHRKGGVGGAVALLLGGAAVALGTQLRWPPVRSVGLLCVRPRALPAPLAGLRRLVRRPAQRAVPRLAQQQPVAHAGRQRGPHGQGASPLQQRAAPQPALQQRAAPQPALPQPVARAGRPHGQHEPPPPHEPPSSPHGRRPA